MQRTSRSTLPSSPDEIAGHILTLRGRKVILDADLAALYGVATRRLNEQVRRNIRRFPADFLFLLSHQELAALKSQFATSNKGRGGRRSVPCAFTEHGALMTATVLNSPHAVEVSIYVVRAFVQLRETLAQHRDLGAKLAEVEKKVETLGLRHDALAASTRLQLKQVFEAIRELLTPPQPARKRAIGFIADENEPPPGRRRGRHRGGEP